MGYISQTTWSAFCDRCYRNSFDTDTQCGDTPEHVSGMAAMLYAAGWRIEGEIICPDCLAEHGIPLGERVIPAADVSHTRGAVRRRRARAYGVRLPGFDTIYFADRKAADRAREFVARRVRQGGRITRESLVGFASAGAGQRPCATQDTPAGD